MPDPIHSPLGRVSAPFDSKDLRRSTIAIPLWNAIELELAQTNLFLTQFPDVLKDHNAAVFHRKQFPGGLDESRRIARERLREAVAELKETTSQTIDPYDPKTGLPEEISLAKLDGRVIRELLAIDRGEKEPAIERIWPSLFEVTIDINLDFKPTADELQQHQTSDSRIVAQARIKEFIDQAKKETGVTDEDQCVDEKAMKLIPQYIFARLEGKVIKNLVAIDQAAAATEAEAAAAMEVDLKLGAKNQPPTNQPSPGANPKKRRSTTQAPNATPPVSRDELINQQKAVLIHRFLKIHHIWPDFKLRSCITKSIATVKADAAHRSFTAFGEGITWAVIDSGVQADHPHFRLNRNVDITSPYHADFTVASGPGEPFNDQFGHGTHVAGIIAGEQSIEKKSDPKEMVAAWREFDANQEKDDPKQMALETICGIAPKCQLISLKALDRFGMGSAKSVIAALTHVQEINHHGREIHIHGVNLSLGYPFEPKWFACGQSPLCVEVNRLAKSGVVVVIAAGNSGYGTLRAKEGDWDATLELTINDPGNAEGAITVGSTHRDMPHMYGVSYFSSKGPTGDGRYKPDLLAPGEKIISCAAKDSRLVVKEAAVPGCNYFEQSGTSMAAPHVSGAIAAFLSIRREFIGETDAIKKIFTSAATDLGRTRYFQGSGLVDLMRAIQSV
jgi:serine protease AprX